MKNFFPLICFALSVCLMTACYRHQPLGVNDEEVTFQQLASKNDIEGMQALVARVNVNAKCNQHSTALIKAADNGAHEAVNFLLEYGADPDIKNIHDSTALILAAWEGHVTTVTALIEHGADPNIKNKDGWTALMWAAKQGHEAIVTALLKRDAKPDIKDEDGWTALDWAAVNDHKAILTALLAGGADPTKMKIVR